MELRLGPMKDVRCLGTNNNRTSLYYLKSGAKDRKPCFQSSIKAGAMEEVPLDRSYYYR